ncbi:MAG: diacylglycerol kinase family protein [Gemmatimonadaceae bacterium]
MIPVFLNPGAGRADELRKVIRGVDSLALHTAAPAEMTQAARAAIAGGASRIVAAGGDGTISAIAAAVAGTECELAVIPAGTLNHFAKDHEIPLDLVEACALAASGQRVMPVDVAYVNGRMFLNTSSVGLYANFVKVRDRLEPVFGYWLGTMLSTIRTLVRARPFSVRFEADGIEHTYTTPLVFIAVGERELRAPTLGGRVAHGRPGLHVMVVRGRTRARLVALSLAATTRGTDAIAATPHLDSLFVQACRIEQRHETVAVDGEILKIASPLEYRWLGNALRLVVPDSG